MTAATVLIADDSLVIRAVVRSELEDEGYRVVEAVDGLSALRQCREDAPDVVLILTIAMIIGWRMPGMLSFLVVGWFLAGFALLVWQLPKGPADPFDDGARL